MRPLLTTLLGILVSHLSFSQQGNIQWVPASDGPAGEKHFRYTPPAGKEVPENAVVKIIHMPYRMITVDLKRDANGFGFAAKLPDTTAVCLMAIMDKKNNIADNNGNRFYTVQLGASADEGRPMYKVERLQLTYWANFSLGGKVPPQEILEGYEAIYASHPEMKFDPSYFDYVRLKHQEDPEKGRVLLQAFAEANIKKGDEQGYRMAIASYYSLKDQNKVKEVQAAALQQYPAGEIARNVFMDAFYEKEEKTDEDILEAMDEYKARFGDTSAAALSTFYMALVRNAMLKGAWEKMLHYEGMLADPMRACGSYNNHAWELSGQDLTSPGSDLEFAEKLSARTLAIVGDVLKKRTEDNRELQGTYNMYADTYALILYKLGRYDEAYQYQHAIVVQGELDTGGRERYAGFALKVKGPDFTRTYLEKELTSGTYSPVMLRMLKQIYEQQQWPMAQFENIRRESDALGKQKAKQAVMDMLGSDEAIDFVLTDKDGKKVKLSDMKGKVVVLDFWATWCGPCLASFPKMQGLVEKYEGKNVAFLFINAWENDEPKVVKQKVAKLLQDKRYSFYVLFDQDDKVIKSYKVEGIPTKFVIDPNGKVVSVDSSDDALDELIASMIR